MMSRTAAMMEGITEDEDNITAKMQAQESAEMKEYVRSLEQSGMQVEEFSW